jgi:sugar phosphate permease
MLIEEEFHKSYSRSTIYLIFVVIFFSNVFINVDHGSLPGCTNQIKADLGIENLEFGILGSIVYGGLTLGSAVATWVYQHDSWIKPTLGLTLLGNALCIYLFTATNSFLLDTYLRFMIGFFQVFACIY